jgi:hypothetical protein
MNKKFDSIKKEPILKVCLFLLFVFTFIPRFWLIIVELPYYSIDENDIVEFSLGYLGGNLNPYWFKYGALYSYILAIIFYLQSLLSEDSLNIFVESYFNNPTNFYITARILNSVIHISYALISWQITRKFFSIKASPYVLFFSLIPFAEQLTNYKIRVDSLLGLLNLLSLYFSLLVIKNGKISNYIFLGLFLGFGLGTKTLPGLLIFPTIYFCLFLKERLNNNQDDKFSFLIIKDFLKPIIQVKNYVILIFVIVGLFISHPYSILEFKNFIQEQKNTFVVDSVSDFTPGTDFSLIGNPVGYEYLILLLLIMAFGVYDYYKRKKIYTLPLVFFIITFWLAFSRGAAREYFYLPLIPVSCILIAYYLHYLINRTKWFVEVKSIVLISIFLLFSISTIKGTYLQYKNFDFRSFNLKISSREKAEKFVKINIPPQTKILFYGYYTSLPRLIDPNPQEFSKYGDFFMYQRWNNKYWIERFNSFMKNYVENNGLSYDLIYQLNFSIGNENKSYYTRYEMGEDEKYILPVAKQMGIPYIITHYNLQKYPEFQNLLVWSSEDHDTIGGNVYIYKIL